MQKMNFLRNSRSSQMQPKVLGINKNKNKKSSRWLLRLRRLKRLRRRLKKSSRNRNQKESKKLKRESLNR